MPCERPCFSLKVTKSYKLLSTIVLTSHRVGEDVNKEKNDYKKYFCVMNLMVNVRG